MPLALPALATLAALLWYAFTGIQVGRARVRYKIPAPATTGNPDFERAFRVQANELEQLVGFLPAMWIFAWFGSAALAALACAAWLAGRIVYALGYWSVAAKRHAGFTIASIVGGATWLAAVVSVVRVLLAA